MRWNAAIFSALFAVSCSAPVTHRELKSERFGTLHVTTPKSAEWAAVFLSDAAGWSESTTAHADDLARLGGLIIGVDTASYEKALNADPGDCSFLSGELERLGQSVESGLGLKQYFPVLMAGAGEGTVIAEAAMKQHSEPFFALLLIDQPAATKSARSLCPGDQDSGFASASVRTADGNSKLKETVEELLHQLPGGNADDLPLVRIPADGERKGVAIFYSGDGGWAAIDKGVSTVLAHDGYSVVGLNSLRYFWKRKLPEEGAKDLSELIEKYYQPSDGKLLLVGFSMGAEVLPFIINRLPEESRRKINAVALMSAGESADFEVHISDWVGFDDETNESPIAPEVEKLAPTKIVCLAGEEDEHSLCALLKSPPNIVQRLAGGHHFDGEYENVGNAILSALIERPSAKN